MLLNRDIGAERAVFRDGGVIAGAAAFAASGRSCEELFALAFTDTFLRSSPASRATAG